jgi:hypothetical protein
MEQLFNSMDPSPLPRKERLEWWYREEAIAYRSRKICAVKAKSRLSPNSALNVCFNRQKEAL